MQLNTLLDADGDLRIILAALIIGAVVLEFISFKFYNTALKWMRAAKLVEAISGSVFCIIFDSFSFILFFQLSGI